MVKYGIHIERRPSAMPESEAKKAWMKANTTVITVKFNHNTEQELLDYLLA